MTLHLFLVPVTRTDRLPKNLIEAIEQLSSNIIASRENLIHMERIIKETTGCTLHTEIMVYCIRDAGEVYDNPSVDHFRQFLMLPRILGLFFAGYYEKNK